MLRTSAPDKYATFISSKSTCESACVELGDFSDESAVGASQMLLRQLDELIVIHASGSRQNDARSLVVGLDEIGQVGTLHVLDVAGGAEDGATEGSACK